MQSSIHSLLETVLCEGRAVLTEPETYTLLAAAGWPTPRHAVWRHPTRFGPDDPPAEVRALLDGRGRLVVKIVSHEILHKSDAGGVRFCDATLDSLLAAADEVWRATARRAPGAPRAGLLVSTMVETLSETPAREVLLSVRRDPAFGVVLFLGLGGLLTEWFGSLSHGESTVPLAPGFVREGLASAAEKHAAMKLLFVPSRLHAQPPLDLETVARQLEALASFTRDATLERDNRVFGIVEIEVNPLLAGRDGTLTAVDGLARVAPLPVAPRPRPIGKMRNLLAPRSAAVLGASAKGGNPGRIILRNLRLAEGLDYGRLFAIHPKEEKIDGVACLPSVEALPHKVDLAVIAIPADAVPEAIRTLVGRTESIILIPGGFAEVGKGLLEQEIVSTLERSRDTDDEGPVMVGGNCLGIVSKRQYNTFFLPQYKLPFHDAPGDSLVAVSQSGAYLVTLSSNLDGVVHPRALISYGNQMDLTMSDFLEHVLEDDTVKVCAFYIEGFKPGDGERFVRLARDATRRGKRVVAFKAGKTPLGARAAQSHTASIAGDYAVARGLMTGAGVLVAETLDLFEDAVKILTLMADRWPEPGGPRRIGILSNAGFECSTVMDRLFGLQPARLTDSTRARLAAALPGIAHPDNPIDTTPMATTQQFIAAAEALVEDPGVDAVLVSCVPVTPTLENLPPSLTGTHSENIYATGSQAQELLRIFRGSRKPMVAVVDSGRLYDEFVQVLQRGGVPTYRKIDRGSRALAALYGALG